MHEYIRVDVWELPTVKTFNDVRRVYSWCVKTFGNPSDERWGYGKDTEFLGGRIINAPEEIEYIKFYNSEDAMIFKLGFK